MAEAYLVILNKPMEGYDLANLDNKKTYKAVLLSQAPTVTSDTGLANIEGANDLFAEVVDVDVGSSGSSNLRVTMSRSDIRLVIWVKDAAVPIDEVYAALVQKDDILDLVGALPT